MMNPAFLIIKTYNYGLAKVEMLQYYPCILSSSNNMNSYHSLFKLSIHTVCHPFVPTGLQSYVFIPPTQIV